MHAGGQLNGYTRLGQLNGATRLGQLNCATRLGQLNGYTRLFLSMATRGCSCQWLHEAVLVSRCVLFLYFFFVIIERVMLLGVGVYGLGVGWVRQGGLGRVGASGG